MLIRLLRKIAQGSRLLLDLLGEREQGREEEILRGPKISVAEAVFTNVMQMPVLLWEVLSSFIFLGSASCRIGPFH